MRHFSYLDEEKLDEVFYKVPEEIGLDSDKELVARSLGATLYMPGLRTDIHEMLLKGKIKGLASMVICLEDAVSDNKFEEAEAVLKRQLTLINKDVRKNKIAKDQLPFLFIRVRNDDHFFKLEQQNIELFENIAGFVFPKFSQRNAVLYMRTLEAFSCKLKAHCGRGFYGMPILESAEMINIETRRDALNELVGILEPFKDTILNIRIGATDFSGLFGLRRSPDNTVYDLLIIRDCISDIINCFCRSDRDYVVSGPVWEYFWHDERMLKPKLRQTPFIKTYGESGSAKRINMLNKYIDGLLYEAILDNVNGLIGKTVIHPSHIIPVHSIMPVAYEDYLDALSIIESATVDNGVFKSTYGNKMNEVKPHLFWAKKTVLKGRVFGVFNENVEYTSLLNGL